MRILISVIALLFWFAFTVDYGVNPYVTAAIASSSATAGYLLSYLLDRRHNG